MTREQFIRQIEREQGPLRRFLCVLCGGDAQRADDIAQEALLKAYLHYQDFSGRSRFSTWLFRIGYNCFCDSQQALRHPLPLEHAFGIPDEQPSSGRHAALHKALGCLAGAERTVVLLFYMEERSVKEIESITGMPSGTVRSHLSRARSRLRRILDDNGELL